MEFEQVASRAVQKAALKAEKAKAAGIEQVVFDRGGNKYTGMKNNCQFEVAEPIDQYFQLYFDLVENEKEIGRAHV